MRIYGIVVGLLATAVAPFTMAAADLSTAYSEVIASLSEDGATDCGEAAGDDRGMGEPRVISCAWSAFRDKKAFKVTRKLALSGEQKKDWDTFIGRSNGQVFRVHYRPNACGQRAADSTGCGPMMTVTPCLLEMRRGGLGCSRPAGMPEVDPAQTSTDSDYAYSDKKPVMIGSQYDTGPSVSRWYLWHLWDSDFKPYGYERLGSLKGADGHMVDMYALTDSRGGEAVIYVDMYHKGREPINEKAPAGMYLWTAPRPKP